MLLLSHYPVGTKPLVSRFPERKVNRAVTAEPLIIYFSVTVVLQLQGKNPMHLAAENGSVDCLRELHKLGADVHCSDNNVSIGNGGRSFSHRRMCLDGMPFFAQFECLISSQSDFS